MHESSKLTGVLGAARDEYDLAWGVHGKLASVGAGMDDENGFDAGAAYVYRLIDSQWVLEAKLLAPDRQLSDGFGRTVAIGGDVAIIGAPFDEPECCYHSRALFKAIGERFDILDRRTKVIMADVLNAWLDPAPCVITALREHLPWLVRTSPLTDVRRLQETIAETRGVAVSNVLPGAGSSDLIYLALRHWLTPSSRAPSLDPTYGEYAHVLARVIGCRIDRLELRRIRSHGIRVNACFVLGLDDHTPDIFDSVYDFVEDAAPFDVQITCQLPFPNTPLHHRLKKQGRLTHDGQWERCTLFDINHDPRPMSAAQL